MQIAYTLADGTSVTLNAVSEPTESTDSASSAAYETVWRLASDPAASLAQDKVQSLLSALCTYAAAQATDADLSACGFDAPVFTAAVTSEDGSTVQLAYACGTDGWYLQVEGDTSGIHSGYQHCAGASADGKRPENAGIIVFVRCTETKVQRIFFCSFL